MGLRPHTRNSQLQCTSISIQKIRKNMRLHLVLFADGKLSTGFAKKVSFCSGWAVHLDAHRVRVIRGGGVAIMVGRKGSVFFLGGLDGQSARFFCAMGRQGISFILPTRFFLGTIHFFVFFLCYSFLFMGYLAIFLAEDGFSMGIGSRGRPSK